MYRLLRRHTATIVALALVTSAISACGSTAAPSAPVTETLSGNLAFEGLARFGDETTRVPSLHIE